MQSDDKLFDRWWNHYHSEGPHDDCSGSCKTSELCFLEYSIPEQIAECAVVASASRKILES